MDYFSYYAMTERVQHVHNTNKSDALFTQVSILYGQKLISVIKTFDIKRKCSLFLPSSPESRKTQFTAKWFFFFFTRFTKRELCWRAAVQLIFFFSFTAHRLLTLSLQIYQRFSDLSRLNEFMVCSCCCCCFCFLNLIFFEKSNTNKHSYRFTQIEKIGFLIVNRPLAVYCSKNWP